MRANEPIRIVLPEGADPYSVRKQGDKVIIDLPPGWTGGVLVIPPGLDFNEHTRLVEDSVLSITADTRRFDNAVRQATDRLADTLDLPRSMLRSGGAINGPLSTVVASHGPEEIVPLPNTLVAASGWCAPSETFYDFGFGYQPSPTHECDDEVTSDETWPQAVRGGIRYETEVTFCDPDPEVLDILTGRSNFDGPFFIEHLDTDLVEHLDTDLVACRCGTEMQACYYVGHVEQDTRDLRHQIIDRKPLP